MSMESLFEILKVGAYALAGLGVVGGVILHFKKKEPEPASTTITIHNENTIQGATQNSSEGSANGNGNGNVALAKERCRILFIDDDPSFLVVKILRKAGWVNTRLIKDITSLDSVDVVNTDLFFVDIQGVGKGLNFAKEGLGLAAAIKKKYPHKKVVIYSAASQGEMFHEAFKLADGSLIKSAEPYEFQTLVETLLVKS